MAADDVLLAPLHVPPAYSAVVARLRRAIALGIVLPGERIPPERTLAEHLGVSRVTVREALRVLQGEGILTTKRGGSGGSIVTARDLTLEQLRQELHGTRSQIEDVFEFRLAVEPMAARLAAARRSDVDLERLEQCQRGLLASEGIDDFRRADSEFHLTVADASRNAMLRQSIEDARAATFEWFDVGPFRVQRESSAAGHAEVIDAIARQQQDEAAAAMAEHLHQAHDEVMVALGDA